MDKYVYSEATLQKFMKTNLFFNDTILKNTMNKVMSSPFVQGFYGYTNRIHSRRCYMHS